MRVSGGRRAGRAPAARCACTATGTIRRHPDIAWHKAPAGRPPGSPVCSGSCSRPALDMLRPEGVPVAGTIQVLLLAWLRGRRERGSRETAPV